MKSRAVAGRGTRWNEDGFFTALEAASPPDEVALARDLLNFATEISDGRVDWGTGKLRGSFTARVVINGERYSVFSVYTTGQATLNAGWNKTKLDQIGSELAEQYRAKTKERLSLSFNERDWTTGWPMIPLSTLVRDNAAVFRELASGFVSDLTAFVSQQQELHL